MTSAFSPESTLSASAAIKRRKKEVFLEEKFIGVEGERESGKQRNNNKGYEERRGGIYRVMKYPY